VSTTDTQLDALRAAVEPVVAAQGLELYDVELAGGGGARTLRVTVTRSGGVDLEAITAVTRAVSPLVDSFDAVSGPFLLEVSSPGIERALRRVEHYAGAVGEQVSVKYLTTDGPRRVHGVLEGVNDAACAVITDDGEREEIDLGAVTQARTVFEWGREARPGRSGRAGARVRAKEKR
jgi:ribosome maturation factor RimP